MKRKKQICLCLNTLICVLEIIVVIWHILERNWSGILYYTNDSNLLALVTSGMYVWYSIDRGDGTKLIPARLILWRYRTASMLMMTFLVVVLILSPMLGEGGLSFMLFDGKYPLTHMACPLLTLITWILFEPERLEKKDIVRSIYPTLFYAVIMVSMNIIRVIDGPYPFLRVWAQGAVETIIWIFALTGMVLLIGLVLWELKFRFFMRDKLKQQHAQSAGSRGGGIKERQA